jgi:hypothetical protein
MVLKQETAAQERRSTIYALRKLGGRATVGDIAAATGVQRDRAELTLKSLLEDLRGHVAVGEQGDLVFEFDRRMVRRDHESWWSRFKRGARRILGVAFKAWIVLMLVVYFVVFVALVIAALVAMMSGDRRGGGSRRGPRMRIPTFWLWYLFWTNDWRWGRPYYGHRWESRRQQKVPFYKKVFAFVFGPDRPVLTREDRDREKIELIRARRGVLTEAELVEFTGLPAADATEEMARLMGGWAGDAQVTPDGVVIYTFPELLKSAHGRVRAREPEPAWRRLEPTLEVTGNAHRDDLIVGAMNGFNTVAAATAPLFIFPRLGLGGPLAWVGLVWIPLAFSVVFFTVHGIRRLRVGRENRARVRRNIRKVLLGVVFESGIEGRSVRLESAARWVRTALDDESIPAVEVTAVLRGLAEEYDADAEAGEDGRLMAYRFPGVRTAFAAAERARSALRLEEGRVGRIVFSSDDTSVQASERELEEFDSELRRRLSAPQRTGYRDDLELIAFDDRLARR